MSTKLSKLWLAGVAAILVTFILAALLMHQSFRLTAICDVTDSLLLASGAASFIPLALRSRGRMRLFYSLIILGTSLWFSYQLAWTYYEVVLRRDVPDLFVGDIVLFLDIVPLMAALALRPHAPADEYTARVGRLDFTMLLVWWFYIYVLIVIPWQYVEANVPAYNRDLDTTYLIEKVAYLACLAASWATSKGRWKRLYANLFGMSLTYVASSTLANWAISRHVYYSGGLYDVPLACAMAWLTWIGLRTNAEEPEPTARETSTTYGVWIARSGMIAVFSIPLFAAWSTSDLQVPAKIRTFRLILTFLAALSMGIMVFVRQQMLDSELLHLLGYSREAFNNLKHLQAQILQSEKLASVGQLVGGAAHELNNPITAMLGYSDLLLSTPLSGEQQPLAARIGQQVRRTRSLVASLISFARQAPAPKGPLDLNSLARTAVKLTQQQWEACEIQVRTQFDTTLPKITGDSNQLLQVCLQLIANSLHVLSERGGSRVAVTTSRQAGLCILEVAAETMPGSKPADDGQSPADSESSLSLSACQGILQEHRGQVSRESRPNGAVVLRVELPAADLVLEKATKAPVLRQSRPYA